MTTTTSTTNAIADEAKANMDALMAKGQGMDLQTPEGKALMAVWNNEYAIKEAAELLVRDLERIERDVDDAFRMISDNEAECLSNIGVFNNLIQNVNTTIGIIKTRRACRSLYGEFLK